MANAAKKIAMSEAPDDLMTTDEVAARMRVPANTVRWWHTLGQLRGVKLGRRRLYPRAEVEAFIAKKIEEAQP